MVISDIHALLKANSRIDDLLEIDDITAATAFADTLHAGPGQESHVRNLRACTYAAAGDQHKRIDLIEEAVNIWRTAGDAITTRESYNLANSLLNIWEINKRLNGLPDTWLTKRDYLHEARKLFAEIANDQQAEAEFRLKALTDAGNSYDDVGRHTDAIACYDRALEIDASFAMARGNRGLALLYNAPFMRGFEREVELRAATELDDAMSNPDSVLLHGGASALESFRRQRSSIPESPSESDTPTSTSPKFADCHLAWCQLQGLFLHVSPESAGSSTPVLDPVFFRRIIVSLEAREISHTTEVIDAFNTIKQDFVSARYLVWASTENSSPIRTHAQSITSRTSFLDTLNYGRWGIRTGIAIQAFKAAVDVLDKVASFVHLYFGTMQSASAVNFRNLPYEDRARQNLAGVFVDALRGNQPNRGLAALIDLSYDLAGKWSSPLSRNAEVRHAATHRFVTVHAETPPDTSDWSERINWRELISKSLFQLRLARSAISYLAQMIDTQEDMKGAVGAGTSRIMPLPYSRLDTDLLESD